LPSGYTYLGDQTDHNGVFTQNANIISEDKACQLTIQTGTQALKSFGDPLSSILMKESETPPPLPANNSFVGAAYDLRPDGATFDPPITITFTYKPSDIPAGMTEDNMVIAYYDGTGWNILEGPFTIDKTNHTISAPIAHFTDFAVITSPTPAAAEEPLPPTPAPTPTPAPAPTTAPPAPAPTETPAPPSVAPAPAPTPAPPTMSPAPTETPAPELKTTNWWLVGGIIVVVLIIAVVIWMVVARRRTA
jgi:hypothetical protein